MGLKKLKPRIKARLRKILKKKLRQGLNIRKNRQVINKNIDIFLIGLKEQN